MGRRHNHSLTPWAQCRRLHMGRGNSRKIYQDNGRRNYQKFCTWHWSTYLTWVSAWKAAPVASSYWQPAFDSNQNRTNSQNINTQGAPFPVATTPGKQNLAPFTHKSKPKALRAHWFFKSNADRCYTCNDQNYKQVCFFRGNCQQNLTNHNPIYDLIRSVRINNITTWCNSATLA